jgi:hypothetical protein
MPLAELPYKCGGFHLVKKDKRGTEYIFAHANGVRIKWQVQEWIF